jgi:hypothetical protein
MRNLDHVTKESWLTGAVNGVSSVLFVASALSVSAMLSCFPAAQLPKMPNDLRTAEVDYGIADFGRTVLDRFPDLGAITDLRYGHFNKAEEPELAIVGTAGAVFVGSDHQVKKRIHFGMQMSNRVILVEPNDAKVLAFLGRGGGWIEKVRVFDENGALRWDYGSFWGVNDSAAGDLHGEGKLEFAVGLNGGGGVRLLNADGRELWSKLASNVWHVEIASTDEGVAEIIHSDASGALTIRNAAGEVLRTCRPAQYVSGFGLTRWASEPQQRHIIIPGQGVIMVLDLNGNRSAQLEAPGCSAATLGPITGTSVCFPSRGCY